MYPGRRGASGKAAACLSVNPSLEGGGTTSDKFSWEQNIKNFKNSYPVSYNLSTEYAAPMNGYSLFFSVIL
jgi:hypothetical protein